jgi:hypothetical protein
MVLAALLIFDLFARLFRSLVDGFLHLTRPIDLGFQWIEDCLCGRRRLRRRTAGDEQNRQRHCRILDVTHKHLGIAGQ